MHKRLSRAALHLSWYALVTVIVLSGLLISLIWLTRTSIDDLRPQILEWINAKTSIPIEVDALEVEWRGIVPHLKLTDIEILDPASRKKLTHLEQANISVDLYKSLTEWSPAIGHLELSGINLGLIHHGDGKITVQGFPEKNSDNNKIIQWLLKQKDLKITDAAITWLEKTQPMPPLVFSHLSLALRNTTSMNAAETHALSGTIQLDHDQGQITFALNLTGDPFGAEWNARLQLTTEELEVLAFMPEASVDQLKTTLDKASLELNKPRLNSNLSFHWENTRLTDLAGRASIKNAAPVYSINSAIDARKTADNDWQIQLPDLHLMSLDNQGAMLNLGLAIPANFTRQKPVLQASVSRINITELFSILPETPQAPLDRLLHTGSLDNIKLKYDASDPRSPIAIKGDFNALGLQAQDKLPSISNLSGHFKSDLNDHFIEFDSRDILISEKPLADNITQEINHKPTKLDHFSGTLALYHRNDGWLMTASRLTVSNPDLDFQLNGKIHKQDTLAPVFDLQGSFFRGNVQPLVNMIPVNLLPEAVTHWLNRAIVSGRLTGGNFILTGPIDAFPFDQQQGIFEVRLNVEDGILDYFEGWPRIEQINSEVLFSGRKLIITSPNARIFNTEVLDTKVEIPDLLSDGRHLLIHGKAVGEISDGLKFIHESPLRSTVGKKLEFLRISGPLDLDLTIDIPFQDDAVSSVNGKLKLNKNNLTVGHLGLEMNSLSGDFLFDRQNWHAKDLKARLFESAITIQLDIRDDEKEPKSDVFISGLADKNYIRNRLQQLGMKAEQLKVLDAISGTTTWQTQLTLPADPADPEQQTGLIITSNLQGLAISSPPPVGKHHDEKRSLRITTSVSSKDSRTTEFEYDQIVSGKIRVESSQEKTSLKHLGLIFGDPQRARTLTDQPLLSVSGNIREFDVSAWKKFTDLYVKPSGNTEIFANTSINLDLGIDQLMLAGQVFEKNNIKCLNEGQGWVISLESKTANGNIHIPFNFRDQPVRAEFDHLILSSDKVEANASETDTKDFPEIIASAKQFQFNTLKLGSLDLHTRPANEGMMIEKLKLSSPDVEVNAAGKWSNMDKLQQSQFSIQAGGPSLDPLLRQFGYGVEGIEGNTTTIAIESAWPGSPAEFALDKVRGTLEINVQDGRLTEVNNRVGRVFGLLSIQSLGRRLSLDFNDLFKKGFSFDSISGKFDVDKGHAYTNDLSMIGPSAQIDITGRVGLADRDYDQIITITPSVSGSLPVASVLFGPIGAGVGAAILLAEQVFTKLPDAIDKVLERQYSLTGSWDDPVVQPVVTEKKSRNESGSILNQK